VYIWWFVPEVTHQDGLVLRFWHFDGAFSFCVRFFRYFSSVYVLGLEFCSDFLPYSGAFMFILLPVVMYRMRLRVLRTYEVHTCVFLGSNIDQ
jgi:hypothetical protein